MIFLLILVVLSSCKKEEINPTIKDLINNDESLQRLTKLEDQVVKEVYLINDKGGTPSKLVHIISTLGYKDHITILAEFNLLEDKLEGIKILEHNETYNYGGYAVEDWFLARFTDKGVEKDLKIVILAAKEPEDIVSLTGATITTVAIVEGVNKGIATYRNYKEGK